MTREPHGYDYDVAIVGGGSAGFAAARTLAAAGRRVAVLEGGQEVGGLCILRGCMPTKALLYAAEVIHLARQSGTWGIGAPNISFNFSQVMARKDALIKEFAADRREQLSKLTVLRVQAGFVDPHTLALSDGARLSAEHFIICTGSVVSPPPLSQLAKAGYITSDEALALKRAPESLLVLGGGPVAVEFAQFFARFDVKVTLVQRSPHILKEFDEDAAGTLEDVFRREGITVFTETKLVDAGREHQRKEVIFEHQGRTVRVSGEEILLALGRSPNTASLGLEQAGVLTEGGRVVTDESMRTSAAHIFAAGDCTGPHEIVHLAVQQGEIAAHNILSPDQPHHIDYRLLASVIFTDPQIAVVGLSEKEARQRGLGYLRASYPFSDHGKSLIMDAKDGFVKLLADPASGEILGGCCVGPLAGELIHEIIAAMHKRMTVHELAAMPHYHPTLAEIWTYPAEELAGTIPRRGKTG
jgi:pyruvate/2-oxoglutarate dehydrogenase complex dihydrolipoamide dehydrogenase (E3) component